MVGSLVLGRISLGFGSSYGSRPQQAEYPAKNSDAATLNRLPNGRRVRFAGLVINCQHPSSANNVTFMTLEDETGWVNLVVWEQVFRDHAVLARTANPLGVTGKVQTQDGVVHLIAERFWQPELPRDASPLPSRDFR